MNRERALALLNEMVTFYLDAHDTTADIEPTNDEFLKMEKFIEQNLSDEKYRHKLDTKTLTDIKADGFLLDSWPIDGGETGYESNTGIECLYEYKDAYYVIQVVDGVIMGGNQVDINDEEEPNFILDAITNHKIASEENEV